MEQEMKNSSACYCINLRRAANAVTEHYDRAMAELGITVNQYSLLANIGKIEPCSITDLSRHVRLDRTTLVRNLKALHAAGWVTDDAAPGNRRSKTHLTPQGERMVQTARLCWMKAQQDIEACLGKKGLENLMTSLHALEQMNREEKP